MRKKFKNLMKRFVISVHHKMELVVEKSRLLVKNPQNQNKQYTYRSIIHKQKKRLYQQFKRRSNLTAEARNDGILQGCKGW